MGASGSEIAVSWNYPVPVPAVSKCFHFLSVSIIVALVNYLSISRSIFFLSGTGIPVLNLDLDREVLGYIVRRIPSTAVLIGNCELAEALASLMEERLPMAS